MTQHPPVHLYPLPIHVPRHLAAAVAVIAGLTAGSAEAVDQPFDYRKVDATLTYRIEIVGQTHTGNANGSIWSKADVNRHLQATLHLTGQRTRTTTLDNPQEQIARTAPARQAMAADLPGIQRIAETCGGDDACINARMMKLVNGMSPYKRSALASVAHGPAPALSQHRKGIWTMDDSAACSMHASSNGASSYRSLDQGEGYATPVSGAEERNGQASTDCLHDPRPEARAEWNGDTNRLGLTLPGLAFIEQWKSAAGKSGTREVTIPDVKLDHLRWSGQGVQRGQQVRHISTVAGTTTLPATMTIRWTFTPVRDGP